MILLPMTFAVTTPDLQEKNFSQNLKLVERIAQGDDIVPVPGIKRQTYLKENVAAVNIVLTPAEITQIEAVLPQDAVAGARYSASRMRTVNR